MVSSKKEEKGQEPDSLSGKNGVSVGLEGEDVIIQKLNIRSAATTVKPDQTSTAVKALKVICAFIILWGFNAGLYAAVLQLTIETNTTILYVYFAVFAVMAAALAGAVLYGMRVRALEEEKTARSLSVASTIMERRERTMAASRAGSFIPRAESSLGVARQSSLALRVDSLQAAAPRADSKVRFQ